ncbi:MAG TPA: hypothetical protein VJU77_18105 [Chthoniobacterales bacterium]|nr:hypothetical protein [Chthoniobacterales bacterium]
MESSIWQRYGLLLGLLGLVLFKLWVVHTEEMYGDSSEYDALWYVGSAKHWYWGTPYSWTAFVRPCAYPLFIAVLHFLGIPLRLGIELMQMAGYAVLILALRKAAVPRALCLFIFAAMILHPAALTFNNRSMSDSFYTAILPLALGGSLLTLLTAKWGHAAWTGVAYAVLWNTREESFLIPVILAVILVLALLQRRTAPNRGTHFVFWLKRVTVLAGTLLLLLAAVYSANHAAFGSFAKSDMSSTTFESAFKALLRINPGESMRYIAVKTDALKMAYEVSPTFAELKPYFEEGPGRGWTDPVFDTLGIREYGPWFMWALRNVTAKAGYYRDPLTARGFYRKVAREINRACDEGRIPSRFVLSSFLDPGALSRIQFLPESILNMGKLFLFRHQKLMARGDTNMVPWMDSLYQEMVFRQPQPQPSFHPETNVVVIPDTLSARLAVATQNFIGANYVYLVIALSWASLAALAVVIALFRRWRLSDPLVTILILLGTTIAARVVFFAFLQATWWMGGYERYLFPVMPLASCFFILLIHLAIALCRNRNAL